MHPDAGTSSLPRSRNRSAPVVTWLAAILLAPLVTSGVWAQPYALEYESLPGFQLALRIEASSASRLDFDGDGSADLAIIGADDLKEPMQVIDIASGDVLWFFDLEDLGADGYRFEGFADIDADSIQEPVFFSPIDSTLKLVDPGSLTVEFEASGIADFGIFDVDRDGREELMLTADGTNSVLVFGNGAGPSQASCSPNATRLCLNQGRFQVEVDWREFTGLSGTAKPIPVSSDDSGLFYFFHPDNWEMLVKVLDGCSLSGHFWVFAAAATNVEYTLTVTDTDSGQIKTYFNPLGSLAPALTDTSAFATCP